MLAYHTKLTSKYLKLLDSADEQESDSPRLTRGEIIKRLEHSEKRIVELSMMKAEVEKNGTIYETDKDSRLMKSSNNGVNISHNVQIAVDEKHHLVVAVDVTSQPIDKEQLHNMALQAKQQFGADALTVLADKGYYSGSEFKKCMDDGITPIVSKAVHNSTFADEEYGKGAFRFDERQGGYICPQGQLLLPARRARTESGIKKYKNFAACAACPVKTKCTSASSKGRTLEDKPYSEYARLVDRQTRQNMDAYHKRKQLAEHPFGTVKQALGFTHFLTRGTESVRAESSLHFLAYNMRRVVNIMGTEGLKAALVG